MQKKNEQVALIWKMSVGKNIKGGYIRCPECGRRLYNEMSGVMTDAVVMQDLGERSYGLCLCGNPCVVVDRAYRGEKMAESWEEQLKLSHEKEVKGLKHEVGELKNRMGKLQGSYDEAIALNAVRGQRIADLTQRLSNLKTEFDSLSDDLSRANKEIARLTELLEHARRVNDNLRDSMEDDFR